MMTKKWLFRLALSTGVYLALGPVLRAQDPLPTGETQAVDPVSPSGHGPFFHDICHKITHVVSKPIEHERVCYSYKEVDRCVTCGAHTPILSNRCPCNDRCPAECSDPNCVKCGKPRMARVLIKTIIIEEVPRPRCEVERVVESVPRHPVLETGAFAPTTAPPAAPPLPAVVPLPPAQSH